MFFVFLEERDIKVAKITYLTMFLIDVDYKNLIKLSSGG